MMKPEQYSLSNNLVFEIREADANDASGLLKYIEEISGESEMNSFSPGEFDITEEKEKEILRICKESPNKLYLIAAIEGKIVGSLSISGSTRNRIRHVGEFGMSVSKEHWGKGIGRALLCTLLKWSKDEGNLKKVNLRVRTDNNRAIDLYLKNGFEVEGRIRRDFCVDAIYYDHYCMGKILE